MYPELLSLASRLAPKVLPLLARAGGGPMGAALGGVMNSDILTDPALLERIRKDFEPAKPTPAPAVSPPISTNNLPGLTAQAAPAPPPVQPTQPMPPVQPMDAPAAVPMPTPRPQMAAPSTPMPQARPVDAPQPEAPMGFFARNTALMRDPVSGAYLDPAAAQRAEVTGPDLIQKFMQYFHNKG